MDSLPFMGKLQDSNLSPIKKWDKVHQGLKKTVPPQFYGAFLKNLSLAATTFDESSVTIEVENDKIADHLKRRYLNEISKEIEKQWGRNMQIQISVKNKLEQDESTQGLDKIKKQEGSLHQNLGEKSKYKEPFFPSQIDLNPKYIFERFVKGPSNEHAFAAALGAAKNLSSFHNPLYLYGGVGLGKTHLMMAIGNHVMENCPWLKVQYTPAEIFQSDLVEAVAQKNLPTFKAKYRNIDVFLFDDIQFISQRAEYTQEEIFHTFNYLYQNKKQIVISGDRPPQQLSTLTDRLRSRFQSGLIVDIKPPNLETRLAILQTRGKEMGLEIPPEVFKYLAIRINSQIRLLEAGLIKLKFTAEVENHPIDLQMAKIALRDMPNEQLGPQVTIDEILRIVSRTFDVDENEIKGSSRVENIVKARHICMYLAKHLIQGMSLSAIAQAFGKTDHTTVIHAEKKIHDIMDRDEAFKIQIDELKEDLQF